MSGRLRQWNERIDDGIQDLKFEDLGRNFSTKHDSYFNARFEAIGSASREMVEEFGRMIMICRTVTSMESVVRERTAREDERVAGIVGGLEKANKAVTDRMTAEIDRCVTVLEYEESGRKKESGRLEKAIRETSSSLKEEIDGMADVMKRDMMGAIERKMSGFLEKIRAENVGKLEMLGDGVIQVREFLGKMEEKLSKGRDEEGI